MLRKIVLIVALLSLSGVASADQLCYGQSLADLMGNVAICGAITYDFTGGTFQAYSTTTTTLLSASDIWVVPGYDSINLSVWPTATTAGVGASAGKFWADGTNTGYVSYIIDFALSIDPAYLFTGIQIDAYDMHFDGNNASSTIEARKAVLTPDLYTADAPQIVDTSDGNPVDISHYGSPQTYFDYGTSSLFVEDSLFLSPGGNYAISVGKGGFTENFLNEPTTMPEPVTLVLVGSVLLGLGMIQRRLRTNSR